MEVQRYIAFDTETGGIPKNTSLLTAYFQVLDMDFNVVDSLYLHTKPNDGIYLVEAEALDINKINLIEHDKTAITYSAAGQELRKFLIKNSNDGAIKLIPLGKQIVFDVERVTETVLGKPTFNKYVSYKMVDVTSLAIAAQHKNLIPRDASISLAALVKFFNISVPGNLHEADYDTLCTVEVYKCLLKL